MRYLLDTHSFLWFILGDPRLSAKARSLMEDARAQKLLRIASVWKIAIKTSLGKLNLEKPFETFLPQQISARAFPLSASGIKGSSSLSRSSRG